MLELSILTLIGLLNLFLALFVLLKNRQSRTHQSFFVLVVLFNAFSAINYLSLHPLGLSQLTWIRLDLLSAVLLFLFTYLTFDTFPNTSFSNAGKKLRYFLVTYALIVSALVMTPAVFSHLEFTGGQAQPVPAPGILFFVLQQIGYLIATAIMIVKKFRRSRGIERQQYKYIISGIVLALGSILIFNLLLVQAFKITSLVLVGSFGPLFFTAAFAYAIIKHRLLDIRAVVARSVAYVLLLLIVTIGYVASVYAFGVLIFGDQSISSIQTAFNIAMAVVLALTLRPLQGFVERFTDRIFYRYKYDSQDVLKELGGVITSELNLEILLNRSLTLLCQYLRIEHGQFVLIKEGKTYVTARYGSLPYQHLALDDLHKFRTGSFIADELEQGVEKHFLDRHGIKVSIALKTRKEFVGFLILGVKRSGDIYTNQDVRLLDISSRELSVAIVNARSYKEIQDFNITLQQKIDEATRKLRRTNERLRVLDQTKDDFISMASHQLRTPLTSVKGYVSMVLDGDGGNVNATQRKLLTQSFLSAQRMVYLISDLLNVSRLKTGKFVIEPIESDLAKVIEEEVEQLEETVKSRNIKLAYRKPEHFPTLMLDETKIRQVMMNFIDNAVYYTPSGGKIDVSLAEKPQSIEFTVTDNGIGVPKREQHHLFSKFYRAHNAKRARPDGTGLGLFMAKKVVIAQGGAVIFKSTEGKGSTFGFTFPKSALTPKKPAN